MNASPPRKVLALVNPRSGISAMTPDVFDVMSKVWDQPEIDLSFQFSRSEADGRAKVRRAVQAGVDTVLVVGGDGMVNTIGAELVGTDVALGVVPTGSGNGFARHFDVPLQPAEAVQSLWTARRVRIDVGAANGRPFFVTCSMAWDATIVRSFERSPVRGVVPYVLAGVYEFLEYKPQPFVVQVDDGPRRTFEDPLVFTVANLTQYGGGALIAPSACPDDGHLELVYIARRHAPALLPLVPRLFTGTFDRSTYVKTFRLKHLRATRAEAGPIQVDGELVQAPGEVEITVLPRALTVLVPARHERHTALTAPSPQPA